MRFGSLFSGIGGLDLGLERAGMECRWQVENNPWCRDVLFKHWPDVVKWDDVRTLEPVYLLRSGRETPYWPIDPNIDLIAGGFPCQPVSYAGRGQAQADERWLWPEFARIVRLLRPRYVLVENVPGLLSRGMGDVLGDLAACGYDTEWDCIPAAAVGAPHLRYRVFIVGHQADAPRPDTNVFGSHRAEVNEYGGTKQGRTELRNEQERVFGPMGSSSRSDWWTTEPDVGRVAHGVPSRVDRLRGLGNAVVPQVAEWIGRRLMEQARV